MMMVLLLAIIGVLLGSIGPWWALATRRLIGNLIEAILKDFI
jgi:type II secretory pathway pseudopilin PulG